MKKLRFGLVGCGRISERHIKAIEACPEAELVAICDVYYDLAYYKSINLNGKDYYLEFDKLLKEANIDIVDICTPNHLHTEMAIQAAKAGKHILLEKPMALNSKDAERIIKACKDAGVKLFVVKQNRFNPPIQCLKDAVDKGRFGKMVMGIVNLLWSRDQEYYDNNEWHGSLEKDGGMLFTQASHHIDMLQWLMGPVKSVIADIRTRTHDIETEDTAIVMLKFESGALGAINATTSTFPRNLEGSITILGEKGTAVIGGMAMNKVDTWEFKDFTNADEIVQLLGTGVPDLYGFGHNAVIKDVVDSVLHGKKAWVTGEEGIKSIRIIEAAYESAMSGMEMFL